MRTVAATLVITISVLIAGDIGASAADCSVSIYADAPPVIPLGVHENWADALADSNGCKLTEDILQGAEVFSNGRENISYSVGLVNSPYDDKPYLGIKDHDGRIKAVSLSDVSVAKWNTEALVVKPNTKILITDGTWAPTPLSSVNQARLFAVFTPYNQIDVDFISDPPGATVWVRGTRVGTTSTAARVDVSVLSFVSLTMDGFKSCDFGDGVFSRATVGRSQFSCTMVEAAP